MSLSRRRYWFYVSLLLFRILIPYQICLNVFLHLKADIEDGRTNAMVTGSKFIEVMKFCVLFIIFLSNRCIPTPLRPGILNTA